MADRRVILLLSSLVACGGVLGSSEDDPPPAPPPADAGPDIAPDVPIVGEDVVAPRTPSTIGVYQPAGRHFALRYANAPGAADRVIDVDAGSEVLPFAGHWNGAPEPGDWVGLHRAGDAPTFHLLAPSTDGVVVQFGFTSKEALPLAGDWNGDGLTTIGFYTPSNGTFYLRNTNTPGDADDFFSFGPPNGLPVIGDWDGDTKDDVGVFFEGQDGGPGAFFLRAGGAVIQLNVITTGGPWLPIAGDWDATGKSRVGLYQPSTGQVRLLKENADNAIETAFVFGGGDPASHPVAGRWQR